MKVLYISSYFFEYIHYPILRLKEDFKINYFVYFFRNMYESIYKVNRKQWDINKLTTCVEKDKFKVTRKIEKRGLHNK